MSERMDPGLARRIRLVGLDVDGVLTDGGVYVGRREGGSELELKRFDIADGLGIKMLGKAGVHVALVSGRTSDATRVRAEELAIECFQHPSGLKMPAMRELLARVGAGWEETAFLADDLADLPVLRRVALPVAVANAAPEVRAQAAWQTRAAGGRGAVREFAETLLHARGEWPQLVDEYLSALEREEDPWAG